MNDEGVPGAPRQDQLLEEASLWFARMRGPDAEAFRPEFETWLGRDNARLGAYNRAGEVFALGKFLAESPDDRTIEERNRPDPWVTKRALLVAASLVLLFGTVAWFGRDLVQRTFSASSQTAGATVQSRPDGVQFSADEGDRRTVILADGSKVAIEPGGLLTVSYSATERQLRLERGRARFEVAHEERPFVVRAGDGSVTARGTIFDVILRNDNQVTVRLLRGAVDVTRPTLSASAGSAPPIVTRLVPGETLSFGSPVAQSLAQAEPPSVAETSHVRGFHEVQEFEKTPLSEVVALANQGGRMSIRLANPSIGDLRVSGRFRVDDAEQVAERLAALFNLTAAHVGSDQILLETRQSAP